MLCLGMHSNVMLRFMVQALQEPMLCRLGSFMSPWYGMKLYDSVAHFLKIFTVMEMK